MHLAEEFRSVDGAVLHPHVVGIPDGRPGAWGEITVCYHAAVNVPQGVFALKTAAETFYVAAFLYARLSLRYSDVFQTKAMRFEKGTLAAK